MPMTMTQKILAAHCGREEVKSGDLIFADADLIMGNDITASAAIAEFSRSAAKKTADPSRIVMVMDHFVPNKDIKAAEQCRTCRSFCRAQGVDKFYDVGDMGIEHTLLPDKGLVTAGDLVIGADSHTCTYGALGAFPPASDRPIWLTPWRAARSGSRCPPPSALCCAANSKRTFPAKT